MRGPCDGHGRKTLVKRPLGLVRKRQDENLARLETVVAQQCVLAQSDLKRLSGARAGDQDAVGGSGRVDDLADRWHDVEFRDS